MSIKITKLTPMNVEALNLMAPKVTSLVDTTKTTATFTGVDARQALGMVSEMQAKAAAEYGKVGGPYASLSAVRRKMAVLVEAEELAGAQARSDARAEADAASDPLMALLDNTGPDPATDLTYGAAIRPKARVTAHVDSEPLSPVGARVHTALADAEFVHALSAVIRQAAAGTLAAERYRASVWSSGRVAGRLLPASKSGQRRPKRSRRG